MSLKAADEFVAQRDVCTAVGEAPHLLIAGASSASASNEEAQVAVLLLDEIITVCSMDFLPKYLSRFSPFAQKSYKNGARPRRFPSF